MVNNVIAERCGKAGCFAIWSVYHGFVTSLRILSV